MISRNCCASIFEIKIFQVIESKGPTNTRVYTVAVYFKGDRLAKAEGPSIQTAEMNAAKIALDTCGHLFPHLDYQKKIVERSLRKNKDHMKQSWEEEVRRIRKEKGLYTLISRKKIIEFIIYIIFILMFFFRQISLQAWMN